MSEENYIPYNLLLKGYENCTLKEKLIWLFYEIKQKKEVNNER